ncbi:MAG TPA: hypothetical protein VK638_02430, partial [Edaphobacter sp.]|nr:hypothetical protein [Edaphobacter sp.]
MPDSLDPWNANPGIGYEPAGELPLEGGNQPLAVPGITIQAGSAERLNLSMPTDNEVEAWAASARQEMGGNHLLAGGIASDIQQSQSHWPEGLGTSNDDLYTGVDSEAHDAPTAGIGTHAGPSGGGSTSSATTGSVLQNAGDEATSPGGTHYTAKSGLELKTG